MPGTSREVLEYSLEIVYKLVAGEDVSEFKNKELFYKYANDEVEDCIDLICSKFSLSIFKTMDGKALVLTPGIENKAFGYNNEELRRKLWGNNEKLYIAYFIIMVIITMFYKESAMDSSVPFIYIKDVIDEVDKKFNALIEREDLEEVSREYSYNFAALAKSWHKMMVKKDEEDLGNLGFKDKISAVSTVCRFLNNEGLILIEAYRGEGGGIVPTERFKSIIYNFFEDRGNKSQILEFTRQLGDE